jgi:hypothetical protein
MMDRKMLYIESWPPAFEKLPEESHLLVQNLSQETS